MVSIFKASKSVVLVVLFIYTILINLNLYIYPPTIDIQVTAPLSKLILDGLQAISNGQSYILTTIFIMLMLMQAAMLNYLVDRHKLLSTYTSLPALCYVLLISLFNEHLFLSPPFLANFAVLVALAQVYSSYNNNSFTQPFDVGLAIGIASLFYLPVLILTIFALLALNITRVFNWRESLVSVVGVLIPYLFLGTFYFVTDGFSGFIAAQFGQIHTTITNIPINYPEIIIKATIILFIVMLAMFFFQSHFFKSIVKIRKLLTILVHLLSISILIFLFMEQFSLAPMALLAIPLSIFLAYSFFEIDHKLTAESIHLTLLGVLLLFQYGKTLL